jgi:spoIIIJ-associated protein
MNRETTATGHTVEEAIAAGCKELGVERDQVDFEILELPTKRLLGLLGASEAKVKVTYKQSTADKAKAFLNEVLQKMGIEGFTIEAEETEESIKLEIEGDGLGIIIGHRGETLDALQYLVSLAANRGEEQYKRVTLDTGNYREKREKTLTGLAKRIALNSVRTRRNTTLEPMNPYERRIIHTAVQEIHGATSWSVGEEPNRRVVIGPDSPANAGKARRDVPAGK